MALYLRYRIEFQCFRGVQDWRVEIWQDTNVDPGTVDLTAIGDPLNIEYNADSDEFNDPLKTSKAVINAYSLTDFELHDLFQVEDAKSPVLIYCDNTIYWQGFLQSGEYSEPYKDVPYPVTITAIDGLSLLKNHLYKRQTLVPDDTYYNGRIAIAGILWEICGKVGFTGFTEYINLYETTMDGTETDSPLLQAYLDVDIFKDMYCDEVVNEILKPFNAVIRQICGEVIVYRPTELNQATVYGRQFTSASVCTGVSFSPAQDINRVATPSDLLQFPGSTLMIKSPAKKITLTQDYGFKESWIDNWELKGERYNDVDATFAGWEASNIAPIGDNIPGEKDGVAIDAISIAPPQPYYIRQSFGLRAIASTTDVFGFELDYLFYNRTGSIILANIDMYIEVRDAGANWFLNELNADEVHWVNSQAYINITDTDLNPGSTGWSTFKRKFTGLPVDGPYEITIWGPHSDGSVALLGAVKNIKFYTSSHNIVMMDLGFKIRKKKKGFHPFTFWNPNSGPYRYDTQLFPVDQFMSVLSKEYEVKNAIAGKDIAYDYIIGDVPDAEADVENVVEQFAGAIAVYTSSLNNSEEWATRGGSENRPILEIAGGEIGGQYSRPTQFLQMEIEENDVAYPVLNLLSCFSDMLNTLSGSTRKFVFNAGEYNAKRRLWSADLLEMTFAVSSSTPGPETDPTTFPSYGYRALYNWYAVNTGLLAPAGWHVPSYDELGILYGNVHTGAYSPFTSDAGIHLKETGLTHWFDDDYDGDNTSGFTALGSGNRGESGAGVFDYLKVSTILWSADENDATTAKSRGLFYNRADLTTWYDTPKKYGGSIRFVKDDSTDPGTVTDYDGYIYPTVKIGDQVWTRINFCGTHYNNGDPIPNLTDNTDWNTDTSGAMCYYENDVVTINSISYIPMQRQSVLFSPQPSFVATSPANITVRIYWEVHDNSDSMVSYDFEDIIFTTGTHEYFFTGIMVPADLGTLHSFLLGKTDPPTLRSNYFEIRT